MSTSSTVKGFDSVFKFVGGQGFYQWRLLAIVSIQMIVLTLHHVGFVFLGAVPNHWCGVESLAESGWTLEEIRSISIPRETISTDKVEWNECLFYNLNYTSILEKYPNFLDALTHVNLLKERDEVSVSTCHSWVYDTSVYESTVVSDFDLVCEYRPLVATIQASYMAGVLVGSMILSTLSDKVFGRRIITLASVFIVLSAGFGAAFAPNYTTFVGLRFLLAMGVAGSFQSCYVLLLEYAGPSCRAFLGVVEQLPFAFGSMLIPLFAYFFRNWFELQLVFTLLGVSLLSYIWILPESSRWLASKGRTEEALRILENVARVNKKGNVNTKELRPILEGCREKTTPQDKKFRILKSSVAPITNFWSLIKTRNLRYRSLAIWTLYFSVTVIYYGLSFLSVRLSSDPYILFFLSGLMEVPAYCGITVPIVSRWGRKSVVITSFIFTGFCLFGLAVTPTEYSVLRIVFTLSGKLFVSCGFAIIYLLGAELYPTTIRTTGLGSAIIVGRFGSMVAPYFVELKSGSGMQTLPVILFGCVAVLAAGVGFTLPKTSSMEMPDNIEDVENEAEPQLPSLHVNS